MDVSNIGATIRTLPKTALNGINDLGENTIKFAKAAKYLTKDAFIKHAPDVVKNNKNAIVGSAVLVAALASVISIAKTIKSKIKENK